MGIIVESKPSRPRVVAPDGVQEAVICDVVDRGLVETNWNGEKKERRKVSIHFLLKDTIPETFTHPVTGDEFDTGDLAGRQYGIQKWVTASLNSRATLRGIMEKVLKKSFSDDDALKVDVEKELLGKQVQLVISHNTKDGTTYANIDNVLPNPKGDVTIPDDYVRYVDRANNSSSDEDDDLPF